MLNPLGLLVETSRRKKHPCASHYQDQALLVANHLQRTRKKDDRPRVTSRIEKII